MARGDGPGRPPLDVPSRLIRITLSLRPEDDDLLAFFDAIPTGGRAQAVMVALRQGGMEAAFDEAEALTTLDDLILDF